MVALVQSTSPLVGWQLNSSSSFSIDAKVDGKVKDGERKLASVRFADSVDIQEIPCIWSLSEEERRFLYLSREEHKQILFGVITTLRETKLHQDEERADSDEDLRGLEAFTPENAGRTRRLRKAVSAVIQRQLEGEINETWLLKHYRPLSEAAAGMARNRALRDEELVPSPVPRIIVMVR